MSSLASTGFVLGELAKKGNATMRVDTTVGSRVFITDGVTEQMISGKIPPTNFTATFPNVTAGSIIISRRGETVEVELQNTVFGTMAGASVDVLTWPTGFVADGNYVQRTADDASLRVNARSAGLRIYNLTSGKINTGTLRFNTADAWPTS